MEDLDKLLRSAREILTQEEQIDESSDIAKLDVVFKACDKATSEVEKMVKAVGKVPEKLKIDLNLKERTFTAWENLDEISAAILKYKKSSVKEEEQIDEADMAKWTKIADTAVSKLNAAAKAVKAAEKEVSKLRNGQWDRSMETAVKRVESTSQEIQEAFARLNK